MKRALVSAVLLAAATSPAWAQGGVSLNWSQCYPQNTALINRNDACYKCPMPQSFRLVSSFTAPRDIPDYVGVRTVIDIRFYQAIPDWWRLEPGGCRAGGLELVLYSGNATYCPDGMAGANQNTPTVEIQYPDWRTIRVISDQTRDNTFALTSGRHYVAQQHTINHLNTTVECQADDDTPVCMGCQTPATLVLREVHLFTRSPPPDDRVVMTAANGRNYVHFQTGVHVPVEDDGRGR